MGSFVAVIHVTYDVVFRSFCIGEKHFVEVMSVADVDNGPTFDAFLVHGNQQKGDAFVFRSVRGRAT